MERVVFDPLRGIRVVYAPERARRPVELSFSVGKGTLSRDECPFCPGNEHMTPPATYTVEGVSGWVVRVFPNRFPALCHLWVAGGHHEVVVETPRHGVSLAELDVEEVGAVVDAFLHRLRGLSGLDGVRYVLLFKNHGPEAGASLSHSHSQIIATPFVPPLVEREAGAFGREGLCPVCAMLEAAQKKGLLVWRERGFAVFCPEASRFPYELWVMPEEHQEDFRELEDPVGFARALKAALSSLGCLGDVPYNFALHTSFWGPPFHWHLEIMPRITTLGGFELGGDAYINPYPPGECAGRLREHLER